MRPSRYLITSEIIQSHFLICTLHSPQLENGKHSLLGQESNTIEIHDDLVSKSQFNRLLIRRVI